jgi:uracil permease
MFLPIAFVTIAEHIGDHTVLGEITGEDFFADPGLDKTLLGDGIATFVSAAIGGPANTTYGENTGVVAMTRVGSVYVTGLAAIFAILLGFFGYVQAFVMSIPGAVIGGMTIVLYGLIAGNGVKVLVKAKVNLGEMRNLIIVATMLVVGLGGAEIPINAAGGLTGMSLAAIVGIVLNLVLPEKKENSEIVPAQKIEKA